MIYGLGIRHVGKYVAQLLASTYNSLDELAKTNVEEFKEIHGLGDKTAEAIGTFFATEENTELIDKLKGIGIKTKETMKTEDMPLKGKKFVFTGGLQSMSRPDASELVKQKGGIVTPSVSKDLDYVVVGEKPGSKYDKAKKLGITIIDEEEFKKLVGN